MHGDKVHAVMANDILRLQTLDGTLPGEKKSAGASGILKAETAFSFAIPY
jgi:hypothetical protein